VVGAGDRAETLGVMKNGLQAASALMAVLSDEFWQVRSGRFSEVARDAEYLAKRIRATITQVTTKGSAALLNEAAIGS
jgi:hypothetical protein